LPEEKALLNPLPPIPTVAFQQKLHKNLFTPSDPPKTVSGADLAASTILTEIKKWHSYTDEEKKPHRQEFTQKIRQAASNFELRRSLFNKIFKIESPEEFVKIVKPMLKQQGATKALGVKLSVKESTGLGEAFMAPHKEAILKRYNGLLTEKYFNQCLKASPEAKIIPPLGVTATGMIEYIEQLAPEKALRAYKTALDPATALGKFFKESSQPSHFLDSFSFYAPPNPIRIVEKKLRFLNAHLQKRNSLPPQSAVSIPLSTLGGSEKKAALPARRATR
jgi:hypothetical protein